MKKFLGIYDKEEEVTLKEKLINFSGVPHKYVDFAEIYVNNDEYVHVTLIDDKTVSDKKDLVLIHGLAGSALVYFKIFKEYSKIYRIIGIDLPGMGW